jgi:hypothetical protein
MAFWTAVISRIRGLVQSFESTITELVLTGSAATEPRFKDAIKEALRNLVPDSTLDEIIARAKGAYRSQEDGHESDALVFATAKGTAEVAKRRQEGPVRCNENEACKKIRKRYEREERVTLRDLWELWYTSILQWWWSR